MTNVITHDFDVYKEFRPKTILRSIVHSLNNDVLNHIYSYLIPDDIDFSQHICVHYTEKCHEKMMYRKRTIVLKYYDFIFQLARQVWANVCADDENETIFPNYRHHAICFRRKNVNQIRFPLHFEKIYQNRIFWMKLFVEMTIDFRFHSSYFCNSEYHLMKDIYLFEDKYNSWFKLN